MIPESDSWQDEWADAVTDLTELRRILKLPESVGTESDCGLPLRVPRGFVDRMEPGNPNDPLLLQILPTREEAKKVDGFSDNPLEEFPTNGTLLRKYPGRALLLTTDRCGIHCRFCFRRHCVKSGTTKGFEKELEMIRRDPTIEEIILSGGDPLMLDDMELDRLLHYIVKIPTVKRIRLHSRLPILLPARMTTRLIEIFSFFSPFYLVLHVNHPNELTDDFFSRLQSFSHVPVLSQTVLMKGINDDIDVLCRLFERLIDHRVIPYYLHQLDRVRGAAHFQVDPAVGKRLAAELRDRLPGYAVPRYVREIVGARSKVEV